MSQYTDIVDAELLETPERARRPLDGVFGPGPIPDLPAAPKADAYAAYVPVAHQVRAQRGDEAAMQKAAIRVGALLGEDGYYRFPAGGSTIEGPNVRLAKALANRWGAVAFGVEVDKIEGDRVYMTATCVDLVSLVVVRRGHTQVLAPPPKKFADKADQRARWEAMQIQSAGSKTLRGAILDCLPAWFVGPAFEAALAASRQNVLKQGQTIETARDEAIRAFGGWKVSRAELEALLGAPVVEWGPKEIAELRDVARSVKSGETTIDEVFAEARAKTAAPGAGREALGLGKPTAPPAPAAAAPASVPPAPATTPTTETKQRKPKEAKPAAPPDPERERLLALLAEGKSVIGTDASIKAQQAAGIPLEMAASQMSNEQLAAFLAAIEAAVGQEGN